MVKRWEEEREQEQGEGVVKGWVKGGREGRWLAENHELISISSVQ